MAENTFLLRQTFLVLFLFWMEPSPASSVLTSLSLAILREAGKKCLDTCHKSFTYTDSHTNMYDVYSLCRMILRTLFWHYALSPSSLDLSGEKTISAIWEDSTACIFLPLIKSKKHINFYCVICWKRYSKWAEVSRNPWSQIQSYCICFVLGCSRGWEQWGSPRVGTAGSHPASTFSSDTCPGSREFGTSAHSSRLDQWSLWLLAFRCNRGFWEIWICLEALIPNFFYPAWGCYNKRQQSYSPGHECSSLKRLLCWNKS